MGGGLVFPFVRPSPLDCFSVRYGFKEIVWRIELPKADIGEGEAVTR